MALNVSVFFRSDANFKPVMAEIAALNKAIASTQGRMAGLNGASNMRGIQDSFRRMVQAGGAWETQTMRLADSHTQMTDALRKQEIHLSQARKSWKQLGGVIEQQTRLRQAAFMTWNKSSFGSVTGDMIIPTRAINEGSTALDRARIKAGVYREFVGSIANETVKWGKNTQWAGRQLTVGLTVPLLAVGVASAVLFKQMDEGLTRVTKVYDTMGKAGSASAVAEKQMLRADSMKLVVSMAKQYGATMQDTLAIESELAAVGIRGNALIRDTAEVTRASMLGELNRQDAIKSAISLQTVFKLNTQQLGEAFNYMNAIENSTSLTMKDFTEAIPRAAAPIAAMGGDIKTLGTFLVAMKAGGIDAAEGANAIKSAFTRILAPGRSVRDLFTEMTGEDLTAIVDRTKGELLPTFRAIGEAMEGLEKYEKQKIMAKIFGTMQNTRLQTLMTGLLEATADGADQVSNAMRVAGQSTEELTGIADREISDLQNSASGKWKRAMEGMKAQLASAGEPLLEIGTALVKIVSSVIGGFNSLDPGVKKFILWAAIIAAIVGPLTMLVGLMANLIGTFVKGGLMIFRWINPFRLLTKEEVANTLAAKSNTAAVVTQTQAYQALALAVTQARAAMAGQAAAMVAGGAAAGAGRGPLIIPPVVGQLPGAPRGSGGKRAVGPTSPFKPAVADTKDIADNAEKARKSFAGTASSAGLAVGTIGLLAGGSSKIVQDISMMIIGMALVAPQLSKLMDKIRLTALLTSAKNGAVAGAMMIPAGGAAVIGGLAAALAAVAITAKLYTNYIDRMKKKQEEFNSVVKNTSDLFGATYKDIKMPEKSAMSYMNTVNEFKKSQAGYTRELARMNDQQAEDAITQKGIEAVQHGYTPDQLKKLIQTYLAARKTDKAYIDQYTGTILARIEIEDPTSQTIESAKIAADTLAAAVSDRLRNANVFNFDAKDAKVNGIITKAGTSLGEMMTQAFVDKAGNKNAIASIVDTYKTSLQATMGARGSGLGLSDDQMSNVRNFGAGSGKIANFQTNEFKQYAEWRKSLTGETKQYVLELERQAAAEKVVAKEAARKFNIDAKGINSLADLQRVLSDEYVNTSQATMGYQDELDHLTRTGKNVSDQDKLAILNKWRLRAGLDAAKTVTQGFGDAQDKAATQAKKHENALASLKEMAPQVAAKMATFLDMFRGGVDSGLSEMVDEALGQFDDATQSHEDSLRAQQERADEYYDRQKKRVETSYDVRIKAIQKLSDKEAAADKAREEMFQREKTRIERLAQIQNATIDFNTALNTGQFDQAAKIQANQGATVAGWALDDSQGSVSKAAEARKAARDGQIESLNKQKDAALEAIDKERDARRKSIDAQIKDYERFRSSRRAQIEKELAMVKAQGARTREEFATRAAEIAKIVGSTTVSVNNQSLSWGRYAAQKWQYYVQLTGRQMASDQKWTGIGAKIADQIAKGATGMNWGQFLTFMATGKLPSGMKQDAKSGKIVNVADKSAGSRGHSNDKDLVRHGGGPIGPIGRNTNRSSLKGDEFRTILQKGEVVVDKNTVRKAGGPNAVMDNIYPQNAGPFPGLAGMMAGVAAMRVGQMMKVGMEQMMQRKILEMSMMDSGMPGMGLPPGANVGSVDLLGTVQRGLKMQESGGNYRAYNPSSGASGAYQYLRSTWANYAGFGEARNAPAEIQDQRVRKDLMSRFNKYKDWRKAVAAHLYPAWAGDMGKWNQSPGYGNPTIWQYVKGVFAKGGIPLDKNGNFKSPAGAGPGALGSGMIKPVRGRKSSDFGMRYDPVYHRSQLHAGTDFAAPSGTPIWSAMNGTVVQAGSNGGYGNYTKVFHGNYRNVPLYTAYAHQSRIGVRKGQNVKQGQTIGNVGSTGASTGPHLHFEVRRGSIPVNPLNWINPNGGLKALPQLLNGGSIKYDNTIANLHKNERVLTAPLSRQLEEGIGNLRSGGKTEYNLTIDARGSDLNEDVLATKIFRKIQMLEGKRGVSKTVR